MILDESKNKKEEEKESRKNDERRFEFELLGFLENGVRFISYVTGWYQL